MPYSAFRSVVCHTTPSERESLARLGYIHVTGLPVQRSNMTEYIGHSLNSGDLGRHGFKNGMSVIVTVGGEVWLASQPGDWFRDNRDALDALHEELCPRGGNAPLPCTNEEPVSLRDLLRRHADHDYNPLG